MKSQIKAELPMLLRLFQGSPNTPKTLKKETNVPSSFSRWRATARETLEELVYLVRAFTILALACNTLFVGLGIVVIPFLVFDIHIAIGLLTLVFTLYFPTYIGDPASNGRRKWEAFRKGTVINDIIRWFSGDIVKTCDLDPKKQYIFAVAPHGIMPLAAVWMLSHKKWPEYFPSLEAVPLGSSVFHFAPLVRDLAMWSGTRHVTKKTFQNTLVEGKSVIMIPGGISELRLSDSKAKKIQLSGKHMGFVRMALKNGTPIVPVYSFGETLIFDQLQVPFLSSLTFKYLKMPFPYFVGMGGFWQIPRRKNITLVIGSPMEVEKVENPTDEQVKAIHDKYYEEITKLFEAHKRQHGHEDYSLEVLYK